MGERQLDEFRRELKFFFPFHKESLVKNILSIQGFKPHYPKRIVNSIYFDTIRQDNLFDSLNGVRYREKIRIRYYDEFKNPRFERKRKNDLYGTKYIINHELLESIKEEGLNSLTDLVTEWVGHKVYPSSIVKYSRNYYINENLGSRATIDSDLETIDLKRGIKRQLKNHFILELKLGKLETLNFPAFCQQIRFSKYTFSKLGFDFNL